MKRNTIIICYMISFIISGCGQSEFIPQLLTPTPAATSTPSESPEEIITNAVDMACQHSPVKSPAVGVSTGKAVARLCPYGMSGIILPEEWTAKTPDELLYVVDVRDGSFVEDSGRCGPYGSINKYLSTGKDVVEISLISTRTGEILGFAKVLGSPPSGCPSETLSTRTRVVGDPPSALDVQKAIVDVISNQLSFPTLSRLTGHTRPVNSVAFSPDGKLLASGSEDNTVKLWDVAIGQEVRTLDNYAVVTSVAFSPDGKLLASGVYDNTVKLWDVTSGQLVRTLTDTHPIISITFSPDGKLLASGSGELLASGSEDNEVKLWDVASGQEVRALKGHTHPVNSVAFSPDGKLLASGSEDNTVKLWDVAIGQEVRTLDNYAVVTSVAFSPDGKLLASGSYGATVKLWDVTSGQELRTFTDTDIIDSVAFSPDGKFLASGSYGATVKLWDVISGKEVRTMTIQIEGIRSIAFSPDGKLLALGSDDTTVTLSEVKLP